MNRGLLITGLIIIAGMCLMPPWQVEAENPYAGATADMLGAEEAPSELTAERVVYRPVGAGAPDQVDQGKEVQSYTLATTRLLLQIVGAAVVFGGLALIAGSGGRDGPA